MEIRFARAEELAQIAALYVENHKSTYRGLLSDAYLSGLTPEYGVAKWSAYLADSENAVWIACEGEVFLGFAAGRPDLELENTWYLDSLHVASCARGKGVGTALIRTAGRHGVSQGFCSMSVCIVRGNDAAGAVYQKLGAEHFSYFEDDFCGTVSHSEKLLWRDLAQLVQM